MGQNLSNRNRIGFEAEKLAGLYFQEKGFRILGKNFFTKWGELDLILEEPISKQIVFVEVKMLSSNTYFLSESFNKQKLSRIKKSIGLWLYQNQVYSACKAMGIGLSRKSKNYYKIEYEEILEFTR